MKLLIQILVLILIGSGSFSRANPAKKKYYKVADIPEELLEKSVAVVREHSVTFELHSIDKATSRTKHVITILSEHGDGYATFHKQYSNLRSINLEKINIYNSEGDLITKVSSNDIRDFSSFSDFSIFDANRELLYIPTVKTYPYTIEIVYENKYNGLLAYPNWQPVYGFDLAIQESSYCVIGSTNINLRYYESNYSGSAEITKTDNEVVYKWNLSNFRALEKEDNSPFLYQFTPVIYTAPEIFSIEGYKGEMISWESFGLWAYRLIEGRETLTESTILKINELCSGLKSTKEKINAIYKYVQSKTRYVSIQEGIGGWQPMTAQQVDDLGYGDCKALTNYTMALLKIAGIESYYTKVRAGRNVPDINKDFVSNSSNHIILCVPIENDTIWLECTSQISPFGFLGSFTSDRNVILVSQKGGKIVRTKAYTEKENTQYFYGTVDLASNGDCKIEVDAEYNGLQYENISFLLYESVADRKKWLLSNLGLNNMKINSFTIAGSDNLDANPDIKTNLDANISSYGKVTGNRIFIQANLMNVSDYIPERNRNRKTDIVLSYPYTDIDTIKFRIPENYIVESRPADCHIENEFGEFISEILITDREIQYFRKLTKKKGNYPSTLYNDFRKFHTDISRADKGNIVLKKNSN